MKQYIVLGILLAIITPQSFSHGSSVALLCLTSKKHQGRLCLHRLSKLSLSDIVLFDDLPKNPNAKARIAYDACYTGSAAQICTLIRRLSENFDRRHFEALHFRVILDDCEVKDDDIELRLVGSHDLETEQRRFNWSFSECE